MGFTNSMRQKLLVVEDDIFMQKIIKSVLHETYEIKICSNGLDALSFLQDGNIPALIISDLNTPVLDGFGLIEQIKASDFFNEIPILILSGEEGSEVRTRCLDAGADDFLAKPFNPSELEARVRVIFRRIKISIAS
ncbi:response regulator [Daejeonella oryzae]|uniref:response regulator n=1 Tax=Daejeonella oryzae TaxID=1122943 RepID=UPI0009DBE17D|nr:response regulator [Daejeonella oryzae]